MSSENVQSYRPNSVVASFTQQSRQRVPQSRTEYRERPNAASVSAAMHVNLQCSVYKDLAAH